jgi:hypothetical protein
MSTLFTSGGFSNIAEIYQFFPVTIAGTWNANMRLETNESGDDIAIAYLP